ncbi:MAG: hypothetical protein GQ574_22895 [Crocinitomix sp.]|nr:hypothetical protein [Crocinitomix sp.]
MKWNLKNSDSNRLPAFTLFESVIAITIITVLIGLGTMIYGNLMHSEKPLAYYQAQAEVEVRLQELKSKQLFMRENFEYENYEIEQKVTFYKGNKKLYLVTYIARAGDKELLVENHLIPNSSNE